MRRIFWSPHATTLRMVAARDDPTNGRRTRRPCQRQDIVLPFRQRQSAMSSAGCASLTCGYENSALRAGAASSGKMIIWESNFLI
jgi:hypothetical protein